MELADDRLNLLSKGGREADEFEAVVIATRTMFAAAGHACGCPPECAHTFKARLAGRALVDECARDLSARQGEVMAAGFVEKAKVVTCLAPFGSVRGDFATARSLVGDQVRKFV